MNRILCILVILLSAQGLLAQTNILKDWKVKYNAPLNPKGVKYYPGRDSLHVTYHSQVVADTISVAVDSLRVIRFQRRMKVLTSRAFTADLVKQTDAVVQADIQYYHITDAGGLVLVLDKKDKEDTNYKDVNVGSNRIMHNIIFASAEYEQDSLKKLDDALNTSLVNEKRLNSSIKAHEKSLQETDVRIKMKVDTTKSLRIDTANAINESEKIAAREKLKKAMDDTTALENAKRTLSGQIATWKKELKVANKNSKYIDSVHNRTVSFFGNIMTINFFTDTTLSLREIKNTTVGALDPSNFYIGIFYTPSAGFRSITIDEPQFADLDALNDRHDAETNRYGHAISLQLGYNYGRHTVYGEYLHLRQGFNSTNQTINWQTGLPAKAAGQRKYVFSSMGLGIGYNYSGYDHFVNTVIELGAYYNFFDVYYQDTTTFITEDVVKQYTNPMRTAGLRKNVFGLKAGLGLSLRPTFRWEIKLMPTIYYNLSPLNNGVLETRLYNIGLTLGVGCRLGNKA